MHSQRQRMYRPKTASRFGILCLAMWSSCAPVPSATTRMDVLSVEKASLRRLTAQRTVCLSAISMITTKWPQRTSSTSCHVSLIQRRVKRRDSQVTPPVCRALFTTRRSCSRCLIRRRTHRASCAPSHFTTVKKACLCGKGLRS